MLAYVLVPAIVNLVPNMSDAIVARYVVHNTDATKFQDKFQHVLQNQMLLQQDYQILLAVLGYGTDHPSSLHFHNAFLDALVNTQRTAQESLVLFKMLGPAFMDLIPSLPFPKAMRESILNLEVHHCVRCHDNYLTRDNGLGACVLSDGSTFGHTNSPEDVFYGANSTRCIGDPDKCATLAEMTHPRDPFRGGRRGAMY
ncbi:hypothetical protein M413DRAFT_32560 [Hebeloma cylindrosporum]|uniref:Uncharacterized protein n=1 Tax=Hebeloma cylindrosporum TaxID=76867 RepID=A0A0C2Y2P7_HEBCY|nr:hypothetical protein M413DRAFT_32560 [Hebeloma cylindrosporum h7]